MRLVTLARILIGHGRSFVLLEYLKGYGVQRLGPGGSFSALCRKYLMRVDKHGFRAGTLAWLHDLGTQLESWCDPPVDANLAVQFGRGWHPPERFEGEQFRWAENNALIRVGPRSSTDGPLMTDIEPGPSLAGEPLIISVLDREGREIEIVEIRKRGIVSFRLPESKTAASYRLRANGSGSGSLNDKRILSFRVFKLGFRAASQQEWANIGTIESGVRLGTGWYPFETFDGESFRWVNDDAAFLIPSSRAGKARLRVTLEAGPGIAGNSLVLSVVNSSGRVAQTIQATKREDIELVLDVPSRPETFRFRVNGGGEPTAGDPRILNFRVFRIHLKGVR
jgi:hypothetical protein